MVRDLWQNWVEEKCRITGRTQNAGSRFETPLAVYRFFKNEIRKSKLNSMRCSVGGWQATCIGEEETDAAVAHSLAVRTPKFRFYFFVSFLSVNWQRIRNKRTTEEKIRPQQQRQQAIADEHWTNATMFQLNTNKNVVDEYVTRCYLLTVRHWDNWIQTRIERFEHEWASKREEK